MPVDMSAGTEVTAFSQVPDFAKGLVKDLRVRWALEEAGRSYRERLIDVADRGVGYFREQPFCQVPVYRDGEVAMFESGAIALHIAKGCEALSPADPQGRARTVSWVFAALNSVEPAVDALSDINIFHADEDWAKARRPSAELQAREKLGRLSEWLADKEHLEGRFTVGDLMMTTVLRALRGTGLVEEFPNLAAYQARCEARPAFRRALDAQLAAFDRTAKAAA